MLRPDGCLPALISSTLFGGLIFMSITWILSSGTCLSTSPSLITSTESATSARLFVGSMARFTGGPRRGVLGGGAGEGVLEGQRGDDARRLGLGEIEDNDAVPSRERESKLTIVVPGDLFV